MSYDTWKLATPPEYDDAYWGSPNPADEPEDPYSIGYEHGQAGKVSYSKDAAYRAGYRDGFWDRFDRLIAIQFDLET